MRVNIGDIVLLPILKFDGTQEVAMFMVVHHDCEIIQASTRFQAVKISTKPATFQVSLDSNVYSFLKHDSFINCSIISSFIEQQVINIIGRANRYIIENTRNQLLNYFKSVELQLDTAVGRFTRS